MLTTGRSSGQFRLRLLEVILAGCEEGAFPVNRSVIANPGLDLRFVLIKGEN